MVLHCTLRSEKLYNGVRIQLNKRAVYKDVEFDKDLIQNLT